MTPHHNKRQPLNINRHSDQKTAELEEKVEEVAKKVVSIAVAPFKYVVDHIKNKD
jgi:hypothetical protein